MKNRSGILSMFLSILFLLVTLSSGMVVAGQERLKRTETHKFTLLPAPGGENDPYSVRFPITLDEPGLITVDVEVGGGRIKHDGSPFKVWIVETAGINDEKTNRIEKRYIKKLAKFKTKEAIYYGVDAGELVRTKGEYTVYLSNLSTKSHAVGTVVITYPAEPQARHKRD
ncbi:hypothetical protein FY034_11600 [Trichlorobacter lovleyi]|uniref:hypothetical protein n=1 Tax=Trichlorobacter lovleyi TaxID=313985 RepID=UPI00223F48A0|nr:hypothetical protein [Trichlorobacter lovleyi]QOX79554.1 hypothetical protein FY034_11600 [Trichlorobacter lovleyi]